MRNEAEYCRKGARYYRGICKTTVFNVHNKQGTWETWKWAYNDSKLDVTQNHHYTESTVMPAAWIGRNCLLETNPSLSLSGLLKEYVVLGQEKVCIWSAGSIKYHHLT